MERSASNKRLSLAKTLSALKNSSVHHQNGEDREFNRSSGCPKALGSSRVMIQNDRLHEKGQRKPLLFLERALTWITQHDRSDDVVRRAGPGKRCDRKSESGFCRPVFPSRVRGACGPHGSSGRI